MDTDGEAATEIGVCFSFENIGTKEVALESSEFQTGLTKGAGRIEQVKKKIPNDAFMRKLLCVLTCSDNGISPEEKDLSPKPSSFSACPLHCWHCGNGLRVICYHQCWCLPVHPLQF